MNRFGISTITTGINPYQARFGAANKNTEGSNGTEVPEQRETDDYSQRLEAALAGMQINDGLRERLAELIKAMNNKPDLLSYLLSLPSIPGIEGLSLDGWRKMDGNKAPAEASDHSPLLVDLELPPREPLFGPFGGVCLSDDAENSGIPRYPYLMSFNRDNFGNEEKK